MSEKKNKQGKGEKLLRDTSTKPKGDVVERISTLLGETIFDISVCKIRLEALKDRIKEE